MTTSGDYTAYGLSIYSEIDLPELTCATATATPHVVIRRGSVPVQLDHPMAGGGMFQVENQRFLLVVEGVARYLVSDGSTIVVDTCSEDDGDSVRLFLLGSVWGALLHQRGLSPLHGSAIGTPGGAVIFAGRSGSGKSALAAAFHARGYPVITDEICAISIVPGGAEVSPAFPRLLLWPNIIEQLGLQGPDVRAARPNLLKQHVPVNTGFATAPSRIRAIYILSVTNALDLSLTPINGLKKIQELLGVAFRRSFLWGIRAEEAHFSRMMALAGNAGMARLARPGGKALLLETADLLEKDFNP